MPFVDGIRSLVRQRERYRLAAVTLCLALSWSAPVGAHLGSDLVSVQADAQLLQGVVSTRAFANYDVLQIATAAGQTVREYLDRRGQVFAVTWSSVAPPDLAQVLGPYHPQYAAGLSALDHPGLKRSVRVATPALIVESSGHLRAYSGRAYLPALLPGGVDLAAIR